MKNVISLLIFLLVFSCLPIISKVIFADTEIKSYKITDEHTYTGTPTLHTVVDHKWINFPWKTGKVMISKNPDGTGTMDLGVQFEIYVQNSNGVHYKLYAGCEEKPVAPFEITNLINKASAENKELLVRFYKGFCSKAVKIDGEYVDEYDVGSIYIVHFDDGADYISPFLKLPWDNTSQGQTTVDAANFPSSYFDHEYPLLSRSFLKEPDYANGDVLRYDGKRKDDQNRNFYYTAHDGYDWASKFGVTFNAPVLAAESGVATFKTYGSCGNMIMIDHKNNFQTRYCHLADDGLITKSKDGVEVSKGDVIGKVGNTGKITGAHIHFMVVEDKNQDGNFEDNIPDGLIDPFGWSGEGDDPWENYTFTQLGEEKTGNKSRVLFQDYIPKFTGVVNKTGNKIIYEGMEINFPENFLKQDALVQIEKLPPVAEPTFEESVDGALSNINARIKITISDNFDNKFTSFLKNFKIQQIIPKSILDKYVEGSVSFYSSTDGATWQKENTTVNYETGEVVLEVNHLTEFAIFGVAKDEIAPETEINITGNNLKNDEYEGAVKIKLTATDRGKEDISGVQNTVFILNNDTANLYEREITISENGKHLISYYSLDNNFNEEDLKTKEFEIISKAKSPTPTDKKLSDDDNDSESTAKDNSDESSNSDEEESDNKNESNNSSTDKTPTPKYRVLTNTPTPKKIYGNKDDSIEKKLGDVLALETTNKNNAVSDGNDEDMKNAGKNDNGIDKEEKNMFNNGISIFSGIFLLCLITGGFIVYKKINEK